MVKKKQKWFTKVRGSYIPCSWQGWMLYIPFITYLIAVLVYATNNSHTAINALLIMFPQFVCSAIVMTWIASQKS